ncbi:MAG: hypothetical protein PHD13_02530 [Methanocellales archaeon]|nr:hypothetical protein [Methanocellales archaeon]MDD3291686.1 hypothetical protein [Methanocellales archaeon]MDD5235036.1 hypothetical protein [Methanocellales archaeon]MDD5485174.1 hypothetical protein [Methanocellales archaeon]
MASKIYVRGRMKVGSGVRQPMFRVVAVTHNTGDDTHLKIEGRHFRKTEIEQIAKDVGAKVVYLHAVPEEERGTMKEE